MVKNFRRWGESTSLIGIPNIMKSDHHSLRFLWLIFTLGMAALLGFGLVGLLMGYVEFVVVQSSYTDNDPSHEHFPDVVVCPRQPFNYCAYLFFAYQLQEGSSPAVVYRWMNSRFHEANGFWKTYPGCFPLRAILMKMYQQANKNKIFYGDIRSPYKFGSNVLELANELIEQNKPREAREVMKLDNFQDFIAVSEIEKISDYVYLKKSDLTCHVESASGARMTCKLKMISHPKHPQCYSITTHLASRKYHTDTADKLVIMLARPIKPADDLFTNFVQSLFQSREDFSNDFSSQLAIHLHPKGHYPNMELEFINVPESATSSIRFSEKIYVKAGTMKSPCTSEDHKFQHNLVNYSSHDENSCKAAFYQKIIQERCDCRSIQLPNIGWHPVRNASDMNLKEEPTVKPYCNKLDWYKLNDLELYKSRKKCAAKAIIEAKTIIERDKECLPLCEKNYYSYSINGIPNTSPTAMSQLAWTSDFQKKIEDYLAGNCTKKVKPNEYACRQMKITLIDKVGKIPKTSENIETTVISIQRESSGVQITEESLIYPTEAFLGELSGLCSVTLALTPIIFMEILEVALRKKKKQPVKEDST